MATVTSDLLAGRTATCGCGKRMPSLNATTQPFFEYRGPGTADQVCRRCRMFKAAHERDSRRVAPEPAPITRDHAFEALTEGYATDSFYCGDYRQHPAGLD